MHPRIRAILPHTLLLILAGLFYGLATRIEAPFTAGDTRIGPASWPKFVLGAMAALCLYEIVKRLLVGTSFTATGLLQGLNRPPPASATAAEQTAEGGSAHGKLAAGLAAIFAFVVGVPYLGFFSATVLFLAAFAWIGGFRRPLAVLLTAVLGGLVLVFIFVRVAYISLPLGQGPFRELSLVLLRLLGLS
jgi:putative tricarboxylic transport membrane protein